MKQVTEQRRGLSEKEFNKISGLIRRRVQLNNANFGKVEKVATPEQIIKLRAIEIEVGPALPFCIAAKILRQIKC